MLARAPAILAVLIAVLVSAASSTSHLRSAVAGAPPSDLNKLAAAEQNLRVCEEQLAQVLNEILEPAGRGVRNPKAAVNKLEAIANKIEVVDRRVEAVLAPLLERHVETPGSMPGVQPSVDGLRQRTAAIMEHLDHFVENASPDIVPPRVFDVVHRMRIAIPLTMTAIGLDYYRAVIPIRFVQFVNLGSPGLSDERLRYSIQVTNEIFRPARLRFYLKENFVIPDTPFTYLYLRDNNDDLILDDDDNRIHVQYQWPLDWWTSPLVWPLHWPDVADCDMILPPGTPPFGLDERIETRYAAQERAGTYCCQEGEIIVYINEGVSNGGQYPWYTRIIGMSSYHMAERGTEWNKFVFAHEVGHYFGLPHTFPGIKHFGRDYDLARIVTPASDDVPIETIRRWYEPHANLVNVETGEMAPLSLFWDMVFRPGTAAGGPADHLFFNSRAEAALWEADLQPISEWNNGAYYRPGQPSCGEVHSIMRLAHFVGAACRGPAGWFGDCDYPTERICTGDERVSAFSRPATDPNRILINVMAYPFRMADGTDVPHDIMEGNFLSQSQLEQIDRVMDPNNDPVTRYFPEMTGMRPQLKTCEGCHSQIPAAKRMQRDKIPVRLAASAASGSKMLGQAFPNPTARSATVSFHLDSPGDVKLIVYDIAGREVRIVGERFGPGDNGMVWDGRGAGGRRAPAGVYAYRLLVDGKTTGSGKVVMVD